MVFNSVTDFEVDTTIRKYEALAHNVDDLKEKLEIYSLMYLEVVDMLYERVNERTDKQYPECLGIEYRPEDEVNYDCEVPPF